jgi:hypothetical protein
VVSRAPFCDGVEGALSASAVWPLANASLAIFLFGCEALFFHIRKQSRMRFDIELKTALLHPRCRRDGLHLDFVGGPLHVEAGQDLLGDPPRDDSVNRSIVDLLSRQARCVPFAGLLRLVEIEVQVRRLGGGKASSSRR